MLLLSASGPANLNLLVALMALGVVIGVFGHMMASRPVILLGIALVGAISVYFVVYTLVPSQ
jgi:hypothetical protein